MFWYGFKEKLKSLIFIRGGETINEWNGESEVTINLDGRDLVIERNNVTLGTYDGSTEVTVDIQVPVITSGTANPSGGSSGDVYLKYS